jgi:hypothetical protein
MEEREVRRSIKDGLCWLCQPKRKKLNTNSRQIENERINQTCPPNFTPYWYKLTVSKRV